MNNLDLFVQCARTLTNNFVECPQIRDSPSWFRDRIMGIDFFSEPGEKWDIAEVLIAEAAAHNNGYTESFFISVLLNTEGIRPLEVDFGAGRYQRPNRPGAVVIAAPETDGILKGIGPYHSIVMNIKKEVVFSQMRELLDGREAAMDRVCANFVIDQDLEVLVKALLESYRRPVYTGRSLHQAELIDGISRRLIQAAAICVPERKTEKLRPLSIRRVLEFIHANLAQELDRDELAKVAGVGPRQFTESFRQSVGVTPKRYLLNLRIDRAKSLLRQPAPLLTVAEIAQECGFFNTSHLCQEFKRQVGTTPKIYREHL